MDADSARARELLLAGGKTLVLVKGEDVIMRTERGVSPLLGLLDANADVRGYAAADRAVGKASAFLHVLLGTRSVYTLLISRPAEEVLLRHGVAVEAEKRVDNILNRTREGLCPMEEATLRIEDPAAALAAIRARLLALRTEGK